MQHIYYCSASSILAWLDETTSLLKVSVQGQNLELSPPNTCFGRRFLYMKTHRKLWLSEIVMAMPKLSSTMWPFHGRWMHYNSVVLKVAIRVVARTRQLQWFRSDELLTMREKLYITLYVVSRPEMPFFTSIRFGWRCHMTVCACICLNGVRKTIEYGKRKTIVNGKPSIGKPLGMEFRCCTVKKCVSRKPSNGEPFCEVRVRS